MKVKKTSKIKNTNPTLINQEPKPIDEHGYPIKRSERCFKCKEKFWLTFVVSRCNYSLKNRWFYWTSNEKDKEKWICSPCLRNIYTQEKAFYLANIKDIKKKRILSSYIDIRI